ncbi:MAG TPA: thioredoxin [Propionibacteriaceae bacterium]|nr:thioredoxin [Propionibacteriaceae bacterium]
MPDPVVACPACGTKNRLPVASAGLPRCASCGADLPWLVNAGDDDFDEAVRSKSLVVVDLWATWCPPCKAIAPVLESLSRDLAGRLKVVKVDVDTSPAIARRYDARSIPMLLLIDNSSVVDTIVGALPKPALKARIEAALARH